MEGVKFMDAVKLSRLMTDKYVEIILVATYNSPKSAQELSDSYDIPIAACYRKIHELEKAGLLKCVGEIATIKGKQVKLYQSQLESAWIRYHKGDLKVRFQLTTNEKNNLYGKWIKIDVFGKTPLSL